MGAKKKLICPHCNVATSFRAVRITGLGELPTESNANYTVRKIVTLEACTKVTADPEPNVNYAILECQSCFKFFIAKGTRNFEDGWSAVYPLPHRSVPKEIPEPIKSQFEEACLCFEVNAYTGCLLMCRTALFSLQREQKANLQELTGQGLISKFLYDKSNEVRLWANIFGHEDVPAPVLREDAEQLLVYAEALLNAIYVEPKLLSDLTDKRKKLKG